LTGVHNARPDSLPPIHGAIPADPIVFIASGMATGYSKTPFAFTFNPLVEGSCEVKVKFAFGGDAKNKVQWGSASEFEVAIKVPHLPSSH
jgi:hypothetical protein